MTNEEFEAHNAELEKQAEVGKWKNAFEALVSCYLAVAYKHNWEHYDSEIDYTSIARDIIEEVGMDEVFGGVYPRS